jgi:hypothetical protein
MGQGMPSGVYSESSQLNLSMSTVSCELEPLVEAP